MNHFLRSTVRFLPGLFLGFSVSSYGFYQAPTPPLVYSPGPLTVPNYSPLITQLHNARGVDVVQVGNQLKIVLGVDCFFRHQSATQINSAEVPTLNCVAQLLRTYGDASIKVIGHTDNVGPDAVKFARSLQQAKTIVAYLWSQGVPLENMTAIGLGDTHPVSSNKTLAGSTENRRIEIIINDYTNYFTPKPHTSRATHSDWVKGYG